MGWLDTKSDCWVVDEIILDRDISDRFCAERGWAGVLGD